jgi:glucuronate isomerase
MAAEGLIRDVQEGLALLPLMDAHTHLVGGKLSARGLHDIIIYHMAVSDLYAAGCPSGARLTQYPGWPTDEEAHGRIKEALPYLPYVRNTSISWGARIILADLYGWRDPVEEDNWHRLDAMIRERADDRAWHREVMNRAGIRRFCTESARREGGVDDDILHYALEWAFFTRCQWGEFDTALYELEKCWGKTPESPTPIGAGGRPKTDRAIQSLDDVHEALDHYLKTIPYDLLLSTATHISTDIDYRDVSDDEMAAALRRRASAGKVERDIYASYINEAFLTGLEAQGDRIAFQFSFGAEPLPYETASRLSQTTIAQLAEMIARHPKLRFQCFLSSRHANQSMCTLCRELPNLTMVGYWWHNFFPGTMRAVMEERLDMLPTNRQVGFFSDGYCVEWAYAKAEMVRNQFAQVLARKIAQGQYSFDEALDIAGDILYDTARDALGMEPAEGPEPAEGRGRL